MSGSTMQAGTGSPLALVLRALRRHRGVAAATAIAIMAVSAVLIFSLEPRYRASALIALETRETRFSDVSAVVASAGRTMEANIARSEAEILGSDGLARQVIEEMGLAENPEFAPKPSLTSRLMQILPFAWPGSQDSAAVSEADRVEAVLAAYAKRLSVFNDGRSYVITLGFQAADRQLAAQIVNHHAALYLQRQQAVKDNALTAASDWLEREVSLLSRRLRDAEGAVQSYRAEHRLFTVRGTTVVQQQLAEFGGELARVRADLVAREARLQQAGPARNFEAELMLARLKETELVRMVGDLEQQLASAEQAEAASRALEREAASIRSLYESLLSRQKQVAAQVGVQQPDARIVSPAVPPARPAFPNKPLFLGVAAMLSAGAALGVALLLERRRQGFDSLASAEAGLGLRALAALPRVPRRSTLEAVVMERSRSAPAEAIRTLRSALASRSGPLPRLLAVTSALPGEGKTSVALALSRSLTGSGLHVLLVEADLRRGRLMRDACQSRCTRGILAVLRGQASLAEAVCPDVVQSLDILAVEGEAANPTDLLEAGNLKRVLATAKEVYDYVIVDTPPVEAVSDALLIGRVVDGTLLVVRAEVTPAEVAAATVKACRDAELSLLGIVLNAADPRRDGTRTGYLGHRGRGYTNAYSEA
ncbi:GumC family protein [Pararoseomonas indoligenes]|uniref:non-specific protein-tyrosine kinase n=1 Tax=Roseomonas indoligenes TaxID=2820811 RepID=A0A940S8T3_9PROT|nr:polysaccharide biosynthesis tyrosine autokinase [Pararoseomonas indoligenes]MBP0496240.1 polysaccharide biosynthesis tyrosine autokinase [Pararoseomonas indoligenes]